MTTFESKIKSIYHPPEIIFNTLSDLNNIAYFEDRIPRDKIKDLSYDTNSVNLSVEMVGQVALRIINREPFKTLKLTAEGTPSEAFMWIQLKEIAPSDTKMKITLKAKLNPMLKMMLKGKMEQVVNTIADAVATIDYSEIGKREKN